MLHRLQERDALDAELDREDVLHVVAAPLGEREGREQVAAVRALELAAQASLEETLHAAAPELALRLNWAAGPTTGEAAPLSCAHRDVRK